MKSYIIGALIGINMCMIWFLAIHLTSTEARVRSLEFSVAGVEYWKAEWNPTLELAGGLVTDLAKLLGHPTAYPGASTQTGQEVPVVKDKDGGG